MLKFNLENSLDVNFKDLTALALRENTPMRVGVEVRKEDVPVGECGIALVFEAEFTPAEIVDKSGVFGRRFKFINFRIDSGEELESCVAEHMTDNGVFEVKASIILFGESISEYEIINGVVGGLTADNFEIDGKDRTAFLRQNLAFGEDPLFSLEGHGDEESRFYICEIR